MLISLVRSFFSKNKYDFISLRLILLPEILRFLS